jgi:tetratricopeptide (TPR) repeat protein
LVFVSLIVLSRAEFAEATNEEYYYEIGESLLSNGSNEEAVAAFDISIAENGTYWNSWYGLAKAYYSLGKYEDGLELCDEVFNDPEAPQGESRSRFHAIDGDFRKAYWDAFHQSPITDPSIGSVSDEIPESYRIALSRYEEALKLDPNSTQSWNSKGIVSGSIGRMNESIECFDRALSINSSHAEVWNNLGVALDWSGRHSESIECYNKSIDLNPNLAVAWMNRAYTLSLDQSFISMARENAIRAIELDPTLEEESSLWVWRYINLF